MSWVSVWFVRTSIIYLGVASVLGIIMSTFPDTTIYLKFIHVHLNLLGWTSMMIYGVGYHIFPRFSGRPLWSNNLATAQFWTAQAGLIGMCLFYPLNINPLFIAFSLLSGISVLLFLINVLKTVKGLS
jgi:cbb3-type cytochrome oxidase subunit 1